MPEPIVEVATPDLGGYAKGNTEIPGVTSFEAKHPGPHVVISALVHGNELCGAWALLALLERGIRPRRGRLSLAFVNVAAFERFDPANPKASRYLDEDLNRVWSAATLDGPRRSAELERGLGDFAGRVWRIGLMGHSARAENVVFCLNALEAVLSGLDAPIEHGTALTAAQHVLAA